MPSNLLRLRPSNQLVNLIEKYGNRFILLFAQLKSLDEGINLLLFFVLVEDMNIIDFKVYFLQYEEWKKEFLKHLYPKWQENCKKTSWNF